MAEALSAGNDLGSGSDRRARRQNQTRERLFRGALKLFAEHGYTATTIEAITEAADVGKGTFFNYFPSKEHIFSALADIQVGNVQNALREAEAGDRPIPTVLARLIGALAVEPGRSPALFRSLVMANLASDAVRQIMVTNMGRGRELLGRIFALGQERGEVRSDMSAEEMARLFQQTFFGMLLMWAMHPPSKLEGWLESTMTLFWSGIAAKQGHRGTEREP
jgi:AcrR family transcriptional regulator